MKAECSKCSSLEVGSGVGSMRCGGGCIVLSRILNAKHVDHSPDFPSWYRLLSTDDAGWPKAMVREVTKAKDK